MLSTAKTNYDSPFSREEIERARRYRRPLYAVHALDLALGLAVPAVLAFGSPGDWLDARLGALAWWGRALAFPALVAALLAAVRLPLSFWRGYLHERRWGFSTQGVGGWLADRAKAVGVSVTLTAVAVFGLVTVARGLPDAWPAAAAPGAALLVLSLGFLAPVVLEPLFNRFAPLADEALAAELRALGERAGVPVGDVLVADASRRTRKGNAYVSGLGRTRRVVLYDTLLGGSEPGEVRLVVAHELGHRRDRHVAKATLLGMGGAAAAVLLLWALLQSEAVIGAVGAAGPGDARIAPFVLLAAGLLGLAALPFQAALSRRWELAADRFSLELTADPDTFEATHRALAVANLLDLDPPRAVYLVLFGHPTPPERIAAGRRWARARR